MSSGHQPDQGGGKKVPGPRGTEAASFQMGLPHPHTDLPNHIANYPGVMNMPPGPGELRDPVLRWGLGRKIEDVLRHRTGSRLPARFREEYEAMLTPDGVAVTARVLVTWAGSHFFGVGEAADFVLVSLAGALFGQQATRFVGEMGLLLSKTAGATTQADLDAAAEHLAWAIAIVGVNGFFALLAKAAQKSPARLGKGLGSAAIRLRGRLQAQSKEWWEVWPLEERWETWPGSSIPKGFHMKVVGRVFRIQSKASEQLADAIQRSGAGTFHAKVAYPLSSLAGALELAALHLANQPAGRHWFGNNPQGPGAGTPVRLGNWELGIDTNEFPWTVYHAVPQGK